MVVEILACPHCDRQFRIGPEALGKKIRCRRCGQLFRIPADTTSVPVGRAEMVPPLAISCVINGRDSRRCPECDRAFSMKPAFAGKVIRCRDCKSSFRVSAAAEDALARQAGAPSPQPPAEKPARPDADEPQLKAQSQEPVRRTVFDDLDDIGEVLGEAQAGEPVEMVVRPRNTPGPTPTAKTPLALTIEVVVGGVVGLAITIGILWYGFGKDPLGVIDKPKHAPTARPSSVADEPSSPPQAAKPVATAKPIGLSKAATRGSPPKAAAFEQSIRSAYSALRRDDFQAADEALASVAGSVVEHGDAAGRLARWRLLADYAKKFTGLRDQAFTALGKSREFMWNGDLVAVIDITPDELIIKRLGKKEVLRRSELDGGVEMAIVEAWFQGRDVPTNDIYRGVRWLCCAQPNLELARDKWQLAKDRRAPVESLLPLLDDPVILQVRPSR